MVEPTHLKNMIVKMGIFPNFRGDNKKYLKPPPRYSPTTTWNINGWNTIMEVDDWVIFFCSSRSFSGVLYGCTKVFLKFQGGWPYNSQVFGVLTATTTILIIIFIIIIIIIIVDIIIMITITTCTNETNLYWILMNMVRCSREENNKIPQTALKIKLVGGFNPSTVKHIRQIG